MSAFTDANFPNMPPVNGMSVTAMTNLANAYTQAKEAFEGHANARVGVDGADPHGIKEYINSMNDKAITKANQALSEANTHDDMLAGDNPNRNISSAQYMINMLGSDTDLITVIKGLLDHITELEATVNTLNLLQFDNVPVGAGIRWWKDTLPEDGTYVWANGQTLYGVNQNFPELARVWELGSSDNVQVPKEDHTIFKVRKATVEIKPIEHAYIDTAAEGD